MPNYLTPAPMRQFRQSMSRNDSAASSSTGSGNSRMKWAGGASLAPTPISRAPLLANASLPGISDVSYLSSSSSISSYNSPSSSRQASSSGSHAPSTANRFGPTASFSPASSAQSLIRGDRAAPPPGMDDDDLDDQLHTFTPGEKADLSTPFVMFSWRGWANALTLLFLALAVVILFAGYPILSFYLGNNLASGSNTAGYNLGGINATGQYPVISGLPKLIDDDTPDSVKTRTGFDGNQWELVFSDEFNKDGRTFFDGDDPFFEAVDLHYWPTGDFEWYDPSAVTTKDGHLVISITQEPIHDLNFKSGMLQSWNKLCFNKNAYFEVSCSFPGSNSVGGFWPGVWTMGNLGRPGYGASTDGMWPYSYDSCDIGTLANQTWANGTGPEATLSTGQGGTPLSYLPGQRASSCTCAGEDHPGPSTNVGRSAPEIDMLEAQIAIDQSVGQMSQSAQVAPYDDYYTYNNVTSGTFTIYDTTITTPNTYLGGQWQQAVSCLTSVSDSVYTNPSDGSASSFGTFGVEYSSNAQQRDEAYITWVSEGKKSWTMYGSAVGPNPRVQVGQRIISEEPMSLVFNLALSNNFQNVDFSHLTFPNEFRIDYIRVWQRSDGTVGCDPEDHPTAEYIAKYSEAYNNANLTTWNQAGNVFPKNSLIDSC